MNPFSVESVKQYIAKEDIFRYLNDREGIFEKESFWRERIEAIMEETLRLAAIKVTRAESAITVSPERARIFLTDYGKVVIESADLAKILKSAHKVHLVAVTLGHTLERRIQYYMSGNPSKGVMMDACASVLAEAVCDMINDFIIESEPDLYHANRFSPGYGDLSMDVMPKLAAILNMEKSIGVMLSKTYMMLPQKSVVYILGASHIQDETTLEICEHKCYNCQLKSCQYRSKGSL